MRCVFVGLVLEGGVDVFGSFVATTFLDSVSATTSAKNGLFVEKRDNRYER